MNVKYIDKKNTICKIDTNKNEGGVIFYKIEDEPTIKYIVHSYMENGECHGGDYFNATQFEEAKKEAIRRICNAIY